MKGVTELGYLGIEASDLNAWQTFAVDLLGMELVSFEEDVLTLRMDSRVQRMIIEKGSRDDIAFSGFECSSFKDLDTVVTRLRDNGVHVEKASDQLTADRAVESLYVTADPEGNRVELYCGAAITDASFSSRCLRSSFVTGDMGMGHYFLIAQRDRQVLLDFYINLLGLKLSDYIRQELAPGMIADAAFLHCNQRHHTLAVAALPMPKRIHHLMLEVHEMTDVGYTYDRFIDANMPIEKTLGMHPNDQMLSFYAITPSGFSIEIGWGGVTVDDENWSVKSYDKLSSWGHRSPASMENIEELSA